MVVLRIVVDECAVSEISACMFIYGIRLEQLSINLRRLTTPVSK